MVRKHSQRCVIITLQEYIETLTGRSIAVARADVWTYFDFVFHYFGAYLDDDLVTKVWRRSSCTATSEGLLYGEMFETRLVIVRDFLRHVFVVFTPLLSLSRATSYTCFCCALLIGILETTIMLIILLLLYCCTALMTFCSTHQPTAHQSYRGRVYDA